MKLSYWELDYVHKRMSNYDIKFQEIYNELFDHIVTAIEEKNEVGGGRTLEQKYNEVISVQFGGFLGIEKVAKSHEAGYKKKVRHLIWGNFKHYLNIHSGLFIVALVVIAFFLPHNKLIIGGMLIVIFALAVSSSGYAYFKLRSIKPKAGKVSLVYSHTITQANMPLIFMNALLWIPQLPGEFNTDYHFKIINIYPAVLAIFLAFVLIYNLSCVRLCKQELKQFVNINPNL